MIMMMIIIIITTTTTTIIRIRIIMSVFLERLPM